MSKRKTAIFLLSVLVALNATFFILKKEVKADVQPYTFLWSVRYTAIQDTGAINERYQLTAEINISANHEVSGRYVVYFYYDTSRTSNMTLVSKNITANGGQIDNVIISNGVCSFNVLVTGQKEVTVKVTGASNNRTSLFQVDGISFSETDSNGNQINDNQSMYYRVTKIEDDLVLINNNIDALYQVQINNGKATLGENIPYYSLNAYYILKRYSTYKYEENYGNYGLYLNLNMKKSTTDTYNVTNAIVLRAHQSFYLIYAVNNWSWLFKYVDNQGVHDFTYNDRNISGTINNNKIILQRIDNNTDTSLYFSLTCENDINNMAVLPLYAGTQLPLQISELTGYDTVNTYTKNQNTIISKIQELINGNSNTQKSVSNNDQTTNQLQQQSDQYHQIESTFQSSFNKEQTQIKEQLNVNPLTSFSKTALWFTDQLTNLYNRSGNFKILFTLPLILGLAMYFIGRGRKVAAPNTVEHYTLVESSEAGEGRTVYKTTRSTARRRAFRDRSKT